MLTERHGHPGAAGIIHRMHLLIPFAAPLSDAGREAARALALPRLAGLLARWQESGRDEGDELSLSPPHERALARALGLSGAGGCLPWAALAARADGLDPADLAWGQVTPCHWHLGTEQVSLLDPAALALDEATSRGFFEALQPLFAGAGFALHWAAPLRWYAAHESLAGLATASLDRVIGRNVDAWLGSDPAARRIRRLQAEAQMLLHTHALNAGREARGLLPVNSFWLSGCGVAQPAAGTPPVLDDRLRGPALAEDWPAWVRAWQALDAGPMAELAALADGGGRLTLCGERSSVQLVPAAGAWRARLAGWLRRPDPVALLETL